MLLLLDDGDSGGDVVVSVAAVDVVLVLVLVLVIGGGVAVGVAVVTVRSVLINYCDSTCCPCCDCDLSMLLLPSYAAAVAVSAVRFAVLGFAAEH